MNKNGGGHIFASARERSEICQYITSVCWYQPLRLQILDQVQWNYDVTVSCKMWQSCGRFRCWEDTPLDLVSNLQLLGGILVLVLFMALYYGQ